MGFQTGDQRTLADLLSLADELRQSGNKADCVEVIDQIRALIACNDNAYLPTFSVKSLSKRVVRLGFDNSPRTSFGAGCKAFAEAVSRHEDLRSIIEIDAVGYSILGDELSMLQDVRRGALDMAVCATSTAVRYCPEIGIFDVPFLCRDVALGRSIFDGAIGIEYAELLKGCGINVLAWFENGIRQLTSNRPIRTPGDMRGLRLRVPQSETSVAGFFCLGASITPLPFTKVYRTLQYGEINAQETPLTGIISAQLDDVQKYISLTSHNYSVGMLIASHSLLDGLSPSQRSALRECAWQGTLRSRQTADDVERDGLALLRARGMTVVEDLDLPAFLKAAQSTMEIFDRRFGCGRVAQLL